MTKKDKGYEVYIARYEGVVYYVGEGKTGRSSHVNSGISNCYLLNHLHHKEGVVFDIEIIPVKTKEEAESLEDNKIKELKPLGNKPKDTAVLRKVARQSEKHLSKSQSELIKYIVPKLNSQLECILTPKDFNRKPFNRNLVRELTGDQPLKKLRRVIKAENIGDRLYKITWIFKEWLEE